MKTAPFIEEFFDTYNPLALKIQGKVGMYNTYVQCYYAFLKELRVRFPRGYIDTVFLLENFGYANHADAERYVRRYKSLGLSEELFVDWESEDDLKNVVSIIVRSIQDLVETKFDDAQYFTAIRLFLEVYEGN